MGFSSVKTYQFRNLIDQKIDLDGSEVFLVGENGQGKTNLLEALYFLSFGSSFRSRKEQEFIRSGETQGAVFGEFRDDSDPIVHRTVVALEKRRKRIKVDGKLVRDRKELIGHIPCVVFTHDDLDFVQGTPDRRRLFFDQTLSYLDPGYVDTLRRYKQVLKMRNSVLKSRKTDLLAVYDQDLFEKGREIQKRRESVVREFGLTFSELFQEISGLEDPLLIRYEPTWPSDFSFADAERSFETLRAQELKIGTTKIGPHRDLFVFDYCSKEFARIGSMGQKRLVALLLRVAQARFVAERTGKKPILLLDDVLLELDGRRRERFLASLPVYDQAFFTFLPEEPYERYKKSNSLVLRVVNGEVKR